MLRITGRLFAEVAILSPVCVHAIDLQVGDAGMERESTNHQLAGVCVCTYALRCVALSCAWLHCIARVNAHACVRMPVCLRARVHQHQRARLYVCRHNMQMCK